jgi:hypothetical protein
MKTDHGHLGCVCYPGNPSGRVRAVRHGAGLGGPGEHPADQHNDPVCGRFGAGSYCGKRRELRVTAEISLGDWGSEVQILSLRPFFSMFSIHFPAVQLPTDRPLPLLCQFCSSAVPEGVAVKVTKVERPWVRLTPVGSLSLSNGSMTLHKFRNSVGNRSFDD